MSNGLDPDQGHCHGVMSIEHYNDQSCHLFIRDLTRRHITSEQIASLANEDSFSITVHLKKDCSKCKYYIINRI